MATSSSDDGPVVSRGDRAALWGTAAAAGIVAVLAVIGTVLSVVHVLGDDPLEVQGMPLADARSPGFIEPLARVVDARYESVVVTVAGAPALARWFLIGSVAVTSLAVVGVCLTLVWLCVRVLQLRPFGRSVTVALVTSSCLIIVAGFGSQLLEAAGRAEIVSFLGEGATVGRSGEPGGTEGLLPFLLEVDLAPIGVGVALAVVALAFQIGARMQRDTEGLV